MDDLVIHDHTKAQLLHFVSEPTHALLLIGSAGMGKKTLAETLATQVLNLPKGKLASHPYFAMAAPDEKGTISIEAIRQLQKFLQLKTTGNSAIRRAVIVENAEGLTKEAQNAYLKLLEEPPADTIMILTTNNKRALLPTILSRVQTITVHAPEETVLQTYFEGLHKEAADIVQARFLSGGLPGLMSALLQDEEHALLGSVRTAKELLQKSTFERLAMVDTLSKQKAETTNLFDALMRMSLSALGQAAQKQNAARIKQWHNIRKEVLSAQIALSKSANAKLVLTKMLLHL